MILVIFFPIAGNKKKIMRKKKNNFWCGTDWATAQLYCEKKKINFLYCNIKIVLQETREKAVDCIAAQGSDCIAREGWARKKKLYFNTIVCIAG